MTRLSLLLAFIVFAAPARAQAPAFTDSAALDDATRQVASQLRCVICQGLSIEDSPSELAQSMRAVVRDMLAEGRSEEEIKAYFVDRYGEWVLLQPRFTGFNLAVYILPVLALLGGAALVWVLARRWSRGEEHTEAAASEDPDLAPWDDLVPRS